MMDFHRMSPPPVEIASQQGEVGDSKELVAPQEEKPSKEAPQSNHVDTPLGKSPPLEPATTRWGGG